MLGQIIQSSYSYFDVIGIIIRIQQVNPTQIASDFDVTFLEFDIHTKNITGKSFVLRLFNHQDQVEMLSPIICKQFGIFRESKNQIRLSWSNKEKSKCLIGKQQFLEKYDEETLSILQTKGKMKGEKIGQKQQIKKKISKEKQQKTLCNLFGWVQ